MGSDSKNTTGALGKLASGTRAFVVLLMAFVASCATRPDETAEIRTIVPQEAVDVYNSGVIELPGAAADKHHTVLALSAGGADGAYGAGVLTGWTASGKRPQFDVVTGVSTGSLLAVFAFLGPQYDGLVRELYTSQTNGQIFRKRGIGGVLSDSLYDNGPLKEQIERYVTPRLLEEVATEFRKGRRLYIATTNIDAGELVIWDMGKIAAGDGGGRSDAVQHFQKVLRASAAVPGYFQPVYIKPKRGVQLRQAHVDGGVKEPVLYHDFMGRSSLRKKTLYMVINATTRRFNASRPVKPTLASISRKTISELLRELQSDTIFRHYVAATNNNIDFRLTSIPDEIPIAADVLNFDPERMQMLFRAGYKAGLAGPQSWSKQPPANKRTTSGKELVAAE